MRASSQHFWCRAAAIRPRFLRGNSSVPEISRFDLSPEEEASARQIKKAIRPAAAAGAVDDVIHSLESDDFCSRIRLTSKIVDSLLHRFGDDWKSALGFFRWAQSRPGYEHTPLARNRMVDLLGKTRQVDRMWNLFREMRHVDGAVTVDTVARVIRRLAAARRWKDAIAVFDELEAMGLERNTDTMNVLLDTLCKEKRVDVAREAYLVLVPSYIRPDARTFNIFVHGWCNARRIDEAMWTIEEMKRRGFRPSVITYSAVLKGYCKQRNFRKVYEVLDSMVSQGCPPNAVTYTTVMNSLAKCGKFEEALGVCHRMKLAGCKPDTFFYNSLINILGRAGQLFEALQVYEVEMRMCGVPCSVSTYNTMISILCYHGRKQDALDVLKEMVASSCNPDLQTYIPLLRLCLSRRDLDNDIHHLLSDIVDKHNLGLDLDTYTLLMHGLCRVGETEWACRLFDEMVGREIVPRSKTCELLMSEAQRKNMEAYVEQIRAVMNHFGISP